MRHLQLLNSSWTIVFTSLFVSLVHSHTVIVYPGWRGDNLNTNGTVYSADGLGAAVGNNSQLEYPYGMQWMYPCGGMPTSSNRTKWPVGGGAVSFQPGWFPGHQTAQIYVNLGLGTVPENMSHPMIAPFQIVGPHANPYPGMFCLPQVPLPPGIEVNIGDNATIQIIETAVHGAALYNCVDITFADPIDVAEVNKSNCDNSSQIGHNYVFSTNLEDSGPSTRSGLAGFIPLLLLVYFVITI